eukprot:10300290-Alexandrium_andersonii.AAC.1
MPRQHAQGHVGLDPAADPGGPLLPVLLPPEGQGPRRGVRGQGPGGGARGKAVQQLGPQPAPDHLRDLLAETRRP